jgi:hypothetical protein
MVRGHYGEFKVLVDVTGRRRRRAGGAGRASLGKKVVEAVRDRLSR